MYQFDKSLERDTFLGKMQVFYPVFFLNISSEEFFYLKSNEQWVLGIFQDFWKLLINRTNAMKLYPASHGPSPDIRAHSFPSLVFAESLDQADHSRTPPHSLEHTRTACDPNLPSTSSSSPIVDGPQLSPNPPSLGSFVPSPHLSSKPPSTISLAALSPLPLIVSNSTTPIRLDRSNVAIRNPCLRPPKNPPGSIEGGILGFTSAHPPPSSSPSFSLDHNCTYPSAPRALQPTQGVR
jgi:hypothetical protein